jgi:hypothetical protein
VAIVAIRALRIWGPVARPKLGALIIDIAIIISNIGL